jgi:hypothetical protein
VMIMEKREVVSWAWLPCNDCWKNLQQQFCILF